MIVDTSAVVAIVLDEVGSDEVTEALAQSTSSRISAATYVELCAVLHRRGRPEINRSVDRLLAALKIDIEPLDAHQARVAAQAYRDFGKGSGHPARLNLGDCYSYALAAMTGEALLYRGEDFVHTDLPSALADPE